MGAGAQPPQKSQPSYKQTFLFLSSFGVFTLVVMGGTPLDIPWEEVMPDRDRPVPMVDVLPDADADAGGRDGGGAHQAIARESCAAGVLTDHQLAEKVERLQRHIASGFLSKLPDKGVKLTANLSALEEEQERRRSLACAGKGKDDEECKEIKQLESRCSPDSLKNISSNATTAHSSSESFGFHFSRFLTQTDGDGQGAYSEELSLMRKDRFKNLNEVYGRKDHRRMSSRASPFLGPKSVINKDEDKQKSLNSHNKGIALSGGSSHQLGETRANRFPKRRKTLENHGSLEPKSTKVHDVVLLDEDVQPVEQIREGDEPDERLQPAKEAKIYYPSSDHPECVELCQSDIKCLKPESYLSSTIMNFYIQYLQNSISSSGKPSGEYHFCNTYFYSKLEEAISHKGETGKHLTKLRRWWKGINIFEKAYIFLPIHKDVHWSLVIICIPAKEDESGPIILHLDSLKFHASALIFDNIERYLNEEWMYLKDSARPPDLPFSERIWRKLPYRIAKKTITVPQQKNEYDCGLFVLYFMERFIEAAPARLRRKDLAMFGSKWFHPEEASALRKRLRKLILEEFVRLENHGAESPASHVSSLED